jgi:hypothetical protein
VTTPPPLTDPTRAQLRELSQRLLRLHKVLLDLQRAEYNSDHVPPSSGTQLLNLVLNDPAFAWLRTLSALIVQVDDLISADPVASEADGVALREKAQSLLRPGTAQPPSDFTRRYQEALQASPDAVVAHAAVMALFA